MNKIVLDLHAEQIKDNDIIVYRNNKWLVLSRESFLAPYIERQRHKDLVMGEKIKELEDNLSTLNKQLILVKLELQLNRGEITQEQYELEVNKYEL